jgi:hypothetical protein
MYSPPAEFLSIESPARGVQWRHECEYFAWTSKRGTFFRKVVGRSKGHFTNQTERFENLNVSTSAAIAPNR